MAARVPFSFVPINVSDMANFGVAQASQLNVFLSHFEAKLEELKTRIEDLSRALYEQGAQEMGDQQESIERNLEAKMANTYTEVLNRLARLDTRTEQISAAGDMVVSQFATWSGQAQTLFLQLDEQALRHQAELEKQSLKHKEDQEHMTAALNDVIRQTRAQFQHVDDSQQILHARDLDILRTDLQTHIAQTRSQDGVAIQAQMQSLQA